MSQKKLKIGWFSFTCCEDSTIILLELMNERFFRWRDLIEFKYFRTLKKDNDMQDLDVAFVEGAISSFKEENSLKEIRKNSRKLIAIGSCACNGSPANQRNFFDSKTKEEIKFILERFEHKDKVSKVSDLVRVDGYVTGCPMDEIPFLNKLDELLKEFKIVN